MQASWIDIFEKAIEFFNGRVKGFKGVSDDNQTRKDMIKDDLKELIALHIERVIKRWKEEALKKKKSGVQAEYVRDDLKDKLCTMIRMCIELCVEIWDPFFLFNELFQKFVQEEMSI
jgi:Fe-S oxidoreductase